MTQPQPKGKPVSPELSDMAKAAYAYRAQGGAPKLSRWARWDELDPVSQRREIEAMRAALLAIRDTLSDETVRAGLTANTCALPTGGELVMAVEPAWEAMVNAILGGPAQP